MAVARKPGLSYIGCSNGENVINLNGENSESMIDLIKKIKETMRINSVFAAVGINDNVNTYLIESIDLSNASITIRACAHKKTLLSTISSSDIEPKEDLNLEEEFYFRRTDLYALRKRSTLKISDLKCLQVHSIFPTTSTTPLNTHIAILYETETLMPLELTNETDNGFLVVF